MYRLLPLPCNLDWWLLTFMPKNSLVYIHCVINFAFHIIETLGAGFDSDTHIYIYIYIAIPVVLTFIAQAMCHLC